MRADYVIKLIESYSKDDKDNFEKIVLELSSEERKKGNTQLSNKIDSALKLKAENIDFNKKEALLSPSSGLKMFEPKGIYTPKDKTSNNSLIDWHYPEKINQNLLVLNESVAEQLDLIVDEYENRKLLIEMGLNFENRLLLCGPPGCGKTSTAFSLAQKLNLPLAYIRLDGLISSLLGQTGNNIRKIFESVNGRNVILFLDEFDAIAKKRDDKNELGELKRVVNTLLQNIDLLSEEVFLIAATNHEELLDTAVWRRFTTVLSLDLPDSKMRMKYLENQLTKYKIEDQVDKKKIANITKGFNFSQLQELVLKTIKMIIFHERKDYITTNDFIKNIMNMLVLFNKSNTDNDFLKLLKTNGLTIREISELTGIPRSTISDRTKEMSISD